MNKPSKKFRVTLHIRQPNAVNSFMICNDYGFICGGAKWFVKWEAQSELTYPSVFKSRRSANEYISINHLNRTEQ